MRIEIVTHVWAEKCPLFAGGLRLQISSLILHQPKTCHVMLHVFYCEQDEAVREVLKEFLHESWTRDLPRFTLMMTSLPLAELGRRCIGRNMAAKQTQADLVWFTDCDHVFSEGCLDGLAAMEWPVNTSMIYPREIMIHRDHRTGDQVLKEATGVMGIDKSMFVPKSYDRAIGGVQIVRGIFARINGYLDNFDGWQKPIDTPFGDFRDDIAFRKQCRLFGSIVSVDLPGVYRIRHTQTTYQ